ncbi:hypothetical protein [Silvimonas iriomotensis]|nr:hypothetical protein [Silvimonas iriomotensis]
MSFERPSARWPGRAAGIFIYLRQSAAPALRFAPLSVAREDLEQVLSWI